MKTPKPPSLDRLKIEQARRHLIDFTERTFPSYRPGWFHRQLAGICESVLADVRAKRSPRVILTAPPQHGKSELVSRRLPAFALGLDPELQIITTSYASDRAFDFSGDVQRIMDSPRYHEIFPETRLPGLFAKQGQAKRTAALFQVVNHRGRYRAAGVGGGITGEPADLLIIDDPIKDFAEAISENVRESTWDWMTSVAFTRLQEGAGVIIMATRWHLDDPIGRLLERQPGRWRVIDFRAIAEEDEPYRLAGEPLSVERYSLDALLEIRDGGATSAYQWNALYQQRPSPLGGGIFKRDDWQLYHEAPAKFTEMIQSWDCAFKDTSDSDFVVGQVWGVAGAGRYLLDQVRARMSFSRTIEAIRQVSAKWPDATRKLVEDKANGSAVIDTLKSEIPGLIAIEPEGGKEARAHAVSAFVDAHNVYLPADARWLGAFIEEAASFPAGAHDDQVDAMTQALNYLRSRRLVLGLVELYERNEKERERTADAVYAGDAPACPKCNSTAVQRVTGHKRCRDCGTEWNLGRVPMPANKGGRRELLENDLSRRVLDANRAGLDRIATGGRRRH